MKRSPSLALAGSLLLSGCFPFCGFSDYEEEPVEECWSKPDDSPTPAPGSQVELVGRVLRQDGAPLTGTVLVENPATAGEVFFAIVTLGLTCVLDDPNGYGCDEFSKLPLDAQGGFTYAVDESETRGTFLGVEYAKDFSMLAVGPSASAGLDGPWVQVNFELETQRVALPEVRLWEGRITTSISGATLQVSTDPLPALGCMRQDPVAVTFEDAERRTIWRQELGAIDLRVLEDFEGALNARGSLYNNSFDAGAVQSLHYTSASVPFRGTAGAPPSRGAACSIGETQYPAGSCPLTDGSMEEIPIAKEGATVDLGQTRSVSMLLLRGRFSAAVLEASVDGQTWSEVAGRVDGSGTVVRPQAALATRFLRLRALAEDPEHVSGITSLDEISVW